ncbi:hypothetical protein O3M35_003396 [Rhynocoris fuscipes]|uniref:Peptidase S1 domain-containing protein n=1 Tax=Rhynocoris fuscipes TaxID=488301 RepID=A0AAW1CRG0_9HEMI
MLLSVLILCFQFCLFFYHIACFNVNNSKSYGEQTSANEVPYVTLVTTESLHVWCIGALITEIYVITSARCVYTDKGFVEIIGSKLEHNLLIPCKFFVHPSYKNLTDFKSTSLYDIALAKLELKVRFNNYINIINIDKDPWLINEPERLCNVIGFNSIKTKYDTIRIGEFYAKYGPNQCKCIKSNYVTCLRTNTNGLCIGENGSLLVCKHKLIGIHSKRLPADICNNSKILHSVPECNNKFSDEI